MVLERGLLHQLASPVLKGFFGVQALGLSTLNSESSETSLQLNFKDFGHEASDCPKGVGFKGLGFGGLGFMGLYRV